MKSLEKSRDAILRRAYYIEKLGEISRLNFQPSTYTDAQGRPQPMIQFSYDVLLNVIAVVARIEMAPSSIGFAGCRLVVEQPASPIGQCLSIEQAGIIVPWRLRHHLGAGISEGWGLDGADEPRLVFVAGDLISFQPDRKFSHDALRCRVGSHAGPHPQG